MTKNLNQEDIEIIRSLKHSAMELSEILNKPDWIIKYFAKTNNIKLPIRKPKQRELDRSKNVNHSFFKQINEDSAYIMGFIAADGCVYRKNGKNKILKITILKKDEELLKNIRDKIAPGIKIMEYNGTKKDLGLKFVTLQVNSAQIFDDLVSFGITERKTHTLEFPNIDSKYVSHFVRGYFDGDGCVHLWNLKVKSLIVRINGTKNFLDAISLNIPGSTIRKSRNIYELSYCSKKYAKMFLDWIYDNSNELMRLSRKYEIYKNNIHLNVYIKNNRLR